VSRVSDPKTSGAAFIGLNGYSAVSLYTKRDWIKGSREHIAEHEGVAYQFTSTEELRAFETEPEKYAPRILGCDPVVLSETERAIPGSTRFAAYFDGRLFLFVSSATRDQFKANPERFAKSLPAITVDQIEYRRAS
jgi:YHS domain-containing protein